MGLPSLIGIPAFPLALPVRPAVFSVASERGVSLGLKLGSGPVTVTEPCDAAGSSPVTVTELCSAALIPSKSSAKSASTSAAATSLMFKATSDRGAELTAV